MIVVNLNITIKKNLMAFELPQLNYSYDALEPHIDARTMEMETFQLFHLAKCSKQPFIASAAAIVVANRADNTTVDGDRLQRVEDLGGKATLHAVAMFEI